MGHSDQLAAHLRSHTYLYVKDIIACVKSSWSVTYSVLVGAIGFNVMVSPTKNRRLCQEKQTSRNKDSGWIITKN